MRQIGVLEARTAFSAILSEVEATGEPVLITRHGKVVARLAPERAPRMDKAEAARRLLALRADLAASHPDTTKPFDVKAAINEGRE